jgi:hypothetical protein
VQVAEILQKVLNGEDLFRGLVGSINLGLGGAEGSDCLT